MAQPMKQGTSFMAWLPTSFDPPESRQPDLFPACEEEVARYVDADHYSDADQSSTVLRKRHCDDLAELESSSWDTEGQQHPDIHSMKRVCSGINFAEGHTEQPHIHTPNRNKQQSDPYLLATHSRGNVALHTSSASIGPHTPTSSSPAAVAGVADRAVAAPSRCSDEGCRIKQEVEDDPAAAAACITRQQRGSSNSLAAGTWRLRRGAGAGLKALLPAAAAAATKPSGTKASAAAAGQHGMATTSSKSAGKRACTRSKSGAASAPKASSSKKSSGSSSACALDARKGPRVRLGGRVLSPEEAEQYLKEVAAAAAAAVTAAASKAAAPMEPKLLAEVEDAGAKPAARAAATATPAATPGRHSSYSRAASPSLDVICPQPAAAATAAVCPASPQLQMSPHASSVSCQLGGTDQASQDCTAYVAVDASLACTADNCTAGDYTADLAAVDSLSCDDLHMTDQLQHDEQLLPHMNHFSWSPYDATMGGHSNATAVAADPTLDALIGSAGSAAGGGSSSLAAAAQADETELVTYRSPCDISCSPAINTPSVVMPCSSLHSRNGSSLSLNAEAPTPQHSGLYKCNTMQIWQSSSTLGLQPQIWMPAGRSATLDNTNSNHGLGRSESAGFSALPAASCSAAVATVFCNNTSSMTGGMSAAPLMNPAAPLCNVAAAAEATTAAAAAAAQAAVSEETSVDAQLQQLLAQWSPAAAAATAGGAASATRGGAMHVSTLQQQQQQLLPGLSAPAGASDGFGGAAAMLTQQQQRVWKPAFPASASGGIAAAGAAGAAPSGCAFTMPVMSLPAAVGSTGGVNNVRIRISSDGIASLITTGKVPPAAVAAAATAVAPVQGCTAAPAARNQNVMKAPLARKSRYTPAMLAELQQQQQQPLQFQMQMQQMPPAGHGATSAQDAPQTRIVVRLKPNQQQQLMAMVDRIVQQRLVQSYEAGFRAASQMSALAGGGPAAAAAAAAMGPASLSSLQAPAAVAAAAATAVVPSNVVQLVGMTADRLGATDNEGVGRGTQLVDDILPSMQDLLSDI